MKRIGITASKIAKGNLFAYNFYVVLISFLFSLFIYVVAGATVFFALVIIEYIGNEVASFEFKNNWTFVLTMCMVFLTIVVTLFNLIAISQNVKLPKHKD